MILLNYFDLKNFIIEWHILLILILGLISLISLIGVIIWKLNKINLNYVFLFLFCLIFSLVILYWTTSEETRYLWLAYFLYYTSEYLAKIYLYSFFFFKCMVFAIPNFLKLLATFTPYEKAIFAGEYWSALQCFFFDIEKFSNYWFIIITEKLQTFLINGPTYRLNLIETNNWIKFFYQNSFID